MRVPGQFCTAFSAAGLFLVALAFAIAVGIFVLLRAIFGAAWALHALCFRPDLLAGRQPWAWDRRARKVHARNRPAPAARAYPPPTGRARSPTASPVAAKLSRAAAPAGHDRP